MSVTTYAELTTAIANWLGRDDLGDRAPEFIALAEAKFNRTLRCVQMEKRSYTGVNLASAEPQYISLPVDYQTMRSLCLSQVVERPRLQYLTDTQIKDFRSNIGDVTAQPSYFGIFGNEIELVPTPNADYEIEMIYRAKLPALSPTNATNWLLDLAPDAYLYGALLEASVLMKADARIPIWVEGLKQAIDSLNGLTKDIVA